MSANVKQETVSGGFGPAFPVTDMPEPPIKDFRNLKAVFLMMGPAVIAPSAAVNGSSVLLCSSSTVWHCSGSPQSQPLSRPSSIWK